MRRDELGQDKTRIALRSDQLLHLILRLNFRVCRCDVLHAAIGHLGFGLDNVNRRQCPNPDLNLIIGERLLRQIHRPLLDLDIFSRKHEIPVPPLRLRYQIDELSLKLGLRDFLVILCDPNLPSIVHAAVVFQQMLAERIAQKTRVGGIERVESAVR